MTGSLDAGEEPEIHALLHDAVDTVGASDDLFDRVRLGAARRRHSRIAGGALVVAAAVGIGVGGALALNHPGTTSQALPATSGPLVCPAALPADTQMPSGHAGTDRTLVPGTPIKAVVCAYDVNRPSYPNPMTSSFLSSQPLTGTALQAVVSTLQGATSPYPISCPLAERYYAIYLEFRYAQGPDVAVTFSVQCPAYWNGTIFREFAGPVMIPPTLADLVPKGR